LLGGVTVAARNVISGTFRVPGPRGGDGG